ncbi:MAG: hypothetical protein AB2692_23540 [Candidatus Thiodiazotropha sp.]
MNTPPEQKNNNKNNHVKRLKTHAKRSHNELSAEERLIKLVRLWARHVAQRDFDAAISPEIQTEE